MLFKKHLSIDAIFRMKCEIIFNISTCWLTFLVHISVRTLHKRPRAGGGVKGCLRTSNFEIPQNKKLGRPWCVVKISTPLLIYEMVCLLS